MRLARPPFCCVEEHCSDATHSREDRCEHEGIYHVRAKRAEPVEEHQDSACDPVHCWNLRSARYLIEEKSSLSTVIFIPLSTGSASFSVGDGVVRERGIRVEVRHQSPTVRCVEATWRVLSTSCTIPDEGNLPNEVNTRKGNVFLQSLESGRASSIEGAIDIPQDELQEASNPHEYATEEDDVRTVSCAIVSYMFLMVSKQETNLLVARDPPAPRHSINCMVMGIKLISKPMIALHDHLISLMDCLHHEAILTAAWDFQTASAAGASNQLGR